jgi:adenosylcobyric acid synthase
MRDISIFGTSSDCGKSTITALLLRVLKKQGLKAATFKAQNVSNNSIVADDGSEIAISQYFQAKVIGQKTSYLINPILLKSSKKGSISLIINGKFVKNQRVLEYYKEIDLLKKVVKNSIKKLKKEYDVVVSEGAGSAVELNLMDKDLSNLYSAKVLKSKIILVADIERGGVFASIYGLYNLLPNELKKEVIGVVVNKFRGDISLFDKGVEIIQKEFGLKVFGVLPYSEFNLGIEDSYSLKSIKKKSARIKVGVIKFPHISNFSDFEPLFLDDEIEVEFVKELNSKYDLIILPGSKMVLEDLRWLKRSGLFKKIKKLKKSSKVTILGICGGFEMMFSKIEDKSGIEKKGSEKGFGFIDDTIRFYKKKMLVRGEFEQFGLKLNGFFIRHAKSLKNIEYFKKKEAIWHIFTLNF